MKHAWLMTGIGICGSAALASAAESTRYRINGVEMRVDYAHGTDASRLIARHMAARPRAADQSPARWFRQGSWQQIASIEGHLSTVLQVRGQGADTEAIRSTIDVRRPVHRPTAPPLWLPPTTELTSEVETLEPDASRQWLARSTWTATAAQTWLRLSARMQGWSVAEVAPESLQLQKGAERLRVDVIPTDGSRERGSTTVITQWSAL
jgi:hypothetical protein